MKFLKSILLFLALVAVTCVNAAPIVNSLSPSEGPISGGNVVIITGSGFTGTTAVDFGFRPAVTFNVLTDTTISAIVPPGTPGTVDVRVTALSLTSPLTRSDFYTYTQNSWNGIISVTNMDAITLFDTGTNTIDGIIPLPADSLSAIITPDGTRIYAANSDVTNISVIDVATNTIIDTIPTSVGLGAFDIIVSPDGTRVYVSNNSSGFVTVIDTTTNTVVTNIFVELNLGPLSITPDGKTVYVSDFLFGNVTAIDTATNTIVTSFFTGASPGMISITPDGTTAYVANLFSNTISIVNVATNTVTGTIVFPAGSGPYGSSILPNGQTLYVANINNSTITVVDIATNTITTTIPVVPGSEPFWVVSTPDSKKVYVINEATDDVTPIDVATNTAGASFAAVPGDVQDLVMSPDQAPVARFTTLQGSVNTATTFDASGSISPIGTIATYSWDFGDGNTVVTNTPIVTHVYTSANFFTVTLTVTNSAGTSTAKVFSSRFMSNNGGPTAVVSEIIGIGLLPPTDVKGFQSICKLLSKRKISNVLTWQPPLTGELPVGYRIYRDAALTNLIGTVSANKRPLEFRDCHVRKNTVYTYYIVSVSAANTISAQVLVIVQPK